MAGPVNREPFDPADRCDESVDLIETGEQADDEDAADQRVETNIRDENRTYRAVKKV